MSIEQPRDHAPGGDDLDPDDRTDSRRIEDHVKSRSTWLRALFMLVFILIYALSRLLVAAVVLLQFLCVLFTGETNARLRVFGQSLALYTCQLIRYLTYNTEVRPFPFDEDWPAGQPGP